jgi:hypothetical protein
MSTVVDDCFLVTELLLVAWPNGDPGASAPAPRLPCGSWSRVAVFGSALAAYRAERPPRTLTYGLEQVGVLREPCCPGVAVGRWTETEATQEWATF